MLELSGTEQNSSVHYFLVTLGLTKFCCHWKSVRFVIDSRQSVNNKAGCVGHIC